MPELPEVEIVRRGLGPRVVGRQVVGWFSSGHSNVRLPKEQPRSGGSGWTVERLERRGKHLLLDLRSGLRVAMHLGMSGRLMVTARDAPRAPHTHAGLDLDGGEQLRYVDPRRFGRFWMLPRCDHERSPSFAALGPDALEVQASRLGETLKARTTPIKTALLDQRVLAGLGNIYVDEILFVAGVHPKLASNRLLLREIELIAERTPGILREAIEAGGSSIRDYVDSTGAPGRFQRAHQVYGRHGSPCLRCGDTIRRVELAGRGTHFCPRCQPWRRRVARPPARRGSQT